MTMKWIVGADLPWDMKAHWRALRIHNAPRSILLDVRVRGPVVSLRAKLWKAGGRIEIDDEKLVLSGHSVVRNANFKNCALQIREGGVEILPFIPQPQPCEHLAFDPPDPRPG
jgi:hypothetical protein